MSGHDPIAYGYEADWHCPECTAARFGPACEGDDAEGNPVSALFPWDEWIEPDETGRQTLACGTCGAIIAEYGEDPEPEPAEVARMRDADGRLPAYAWPGGYPVEYLTRDGLVICPECANRADTSDPVAAGEVYWEGPTVACDDCGQPIASAYGDPDEPEPDEPAPDPATVRAAEDERVLAPARERGKSDGEAAASWVGDGNTDPVTWARLLAGMRDGDPAILDSLPAPDLSGQWAGSLTGPELVRDCIASAGLRHCDGSDDPDPFGHAPGACNVCDWWDATGTVCDAYEDAFSLAVADEVERRAAYMVEPEPEPARKPARKLPRCVECGKPIRAREYMHAADGTYAHILCPTRFG
jgi:hypothetical protein